MIKTAPLLLVILLLTACESMVHVRGNLLTEDDMKHIQVGKTTQEELKQILGPPTYIEQFSGKGWYYIGEETHTKSFFDPDVEERQVILFTFDKNGIVQRIQMHDETAGLDVEPNEDKTPTLGRDPALFKEIFGGIGKYDEGKHRTGYV